jgi:lipopolysaccharide transport system permease protein
MTISRWAPIKLSPAWQHRVDLLRGLVARDLKVRYKGSFLGIAWGLVTPLAQLLVFVLVFRGVVQLDIPHYATFVFSGILAWNWFQSSLYGSASSLMDGRGLIRRPGFPAAVLPAVTVTTNLIHYLLALPILVPFMLYDGVSLTSAVCLLPLLLAIQFALTLSLAYLVAISQVAFRDTQQLLGLVMMLLFYLTPIFYDSSSVPAQYRWLYQLNPLVHLIDAHRAVLLRGELPSLQLLGGLTLAASVLLFFGYRAFKRASHRLAEEL